MASLSQIHNPFHEVQLMVEGATKTLLAAEEQRDAKFEEALLEIIAGPDGSAAVSTMTAELFDPTKVEAAESLLAEVGSGKNLEEILATEAASTFSSIVMEIPKKVAVDIDNFARFVQGKLKSLSQERATERALGLVRKQYAADLNRSRVGISFASEFESLVAATCEKNKEIFARSDHEPIHATLTMDDSSSFKVSSWNVQERVENGVLTYISSMPFIAGKRGLSRKLTNWFLRDEVRQEHLRQVMQFVRRELIGSAGARPRADAVVLQELSPDVIGALSSEFGDELYLHASELPPEPDTPQHCWAMTIVVSRHELTPQPDVMTTTQQATKLITRRFATVIVPSFNLLLSSVHVRHSSESDRKPDGVLSLNRSNIIEALVSLSNLLSPSFRGILAVGDFNGLLSPPFTEIEDNQYTASSPTTPTVPPPVLLPIDGAVWISSSDPAGSRMGRADEDSPLVSCVVAPRP